MVQNLLGTKKTRNLLKLRAILSFLGCLTTIKWWRRRESNPRPQALRLRLYMLSHVFVFSRLTSRLAG